MIMLNPGNLLQNGTIHSNVFLLYAYRASQNMDHDCKKGFDVGMEGLYDNFC